MDGSEIIARVSKAKTQSDLPNLIRDLACVDQTLLFDTLFPVSIRRQGIDNGPVAFSAYVIHAINPPCRLPPSEALSQMVQHEWDISIEEVPWYLANQFGADKVLKCVDDALNEQTDEGARVRLKTVRYWVDRNRKKP